MRKGQVRKTELHRRRKRKEKLAKLRKKFLLAKTSQEKEQVLAKVKRVAPWLSKDEFLKPLEKQGS